MSRTRYLCLGVKSTFSFTHFMWLIVQCMVSLTILWIQVFFTFRCCLSPPKSTLVWQAVEEHCHCRTVHFLSKRRTVSPEVALVVCSLINETVLSYCQVYQNFRGETIATFKAFPVELGKYFYLSEIPDNLPLSGMMLYHF